MLGFITEPQYNQSLLVNYLNFAADDPGASYTVTLQESMPSMKLVDRHPAESAVQNISTYVMPYFISLTVANETTREFANTFSPAVECSQIPFIRDDPEQALFYRSNPAEPLPWWCPSVDSFEIENDPWQTQKGSQFNMVLHYCDTAAEALGIDPDDSGCETDHEIVDAYMNKVDLGTRVSS